MSRPPSGLRVLPLPFHHPGWRGSPHPDFYSQKSSSSCLYAPGREDQDSSCFEVEAEKSPPSCQGEGPPLLGLEGKEPVLSSRRSRTPKPTFPPSSLPRRSFTTFPGRVPGPASPAPDGNLSRGGPPSSPSHFADGRSCEVSVRPKPGYGPAGSNGEEGEEEEEEAEKKNDLQKSPPLEFPALDKASPGSKPKPVTASLDVMFPNVCCI